MYIPVIAGPTGTGKTKISIELAKKINGEIISSDSMQIYKEMNIGTAKISDEEMENIPHHMLSIVSPKENFSVADYIKIVEEKIDEIIAKGKVPIIVGGTGLYVNALVYGIKHGDTFDENLRRELNKKALNEKEYLKLYNEAKKIDPEAMEKISFGDKKRVLRVIEIFKTTNKTKTKVDEIQKEDKNKRKHDFKIFALGMQRDLQYSVVEKRIDKMVEEGLIEENIYIFNKYFKDEFVKNNIYLPDKEENIKNVNESENEKIKQFVENIKKEYTSMQAIGYKEILKYILGISSKEEAVLDLKKYTRRYSKRQYTWFKKNDCIWIDVSDLHLEDNLKKEKKINEIIKKIEEEIK